MNSYLVDLLYDVLTMFEIEEFDKDAQKREATCKVNKKVEDNINKLDGFDDVEENVVRRLKKWTNKCESKSPFCRRNGHFASKFPFWE